MSAFTEGEIEYLKGQRLGRLATVDRTGEPHVVPVSFRYNAALDAVDIGGHNLSASKKFRDAKSTGRAALVVDDVLPGEAWRPRGIETRGRAEVVGEGGAGVGAGFDEALIRIHPSRIVAWGIDTHPFRPNSRRVGRGAPVKPGPGRSDGRGRPGRHQDGVLPVLLLGATATVVVPSMGER